MSAYKEWIRLGRDPIYNHEYYALSRESAEDLAVRFIEATPDRVSQLRALIVERRPDLSWKPDFTEKAFITLGDVFVELVETRPRTQAEIKADLDRQRQDQPDILALLGDSMREWEPTDRSYSIAYDAGLYFAQDLMSKEPRLKWQVETRQNSNFNHPVLKAPRGGRRVPQVFRSPVGIFMTALYNVGSGEPHHTVSWAVIYREWMKYLAEYLSDNPRTD
jgi:hypothetical protein